MSLIKSVKEFELDIEAVKQMIKENIEKETGKTVARVVFDVGADWVGYGANETKISVLKCIKVIFV